MPLAAFLQNLQIWPHTGRSKFKIWPNFDPKSRFGLSFGFGWSDVDKNRHSEATWPWEQACSGVFEIFQKWTPTSRGQRSKFYLILTRNHVLACHSDLAGPMWTKIGTVKQLDHRNKPVTAFLKFSKNWPLPVGVKGQIWLEIWSKIRVLASNSKSVSRINTKSYMDMHCIHIMCPTWKFSL